MLKKFYLFFGIILLLGALFLFIQKPKNVIDDGSNYGIIICSVVGIMCLVMYSLVDKLLKKDN